MKIIIFILAIFLLLIIIRGYLSKKEKMRLKKYFSKIKFSKWYEKRQEIFVIVIALSFALPAFMMGYSYWKGGILVIVVIGITILIAPLVVSLIVKGIYSAVNEKIITNKQVVFIYLITWLFIYFIWGGSLLILFLYSA
ncbi:MAG: hypothetical protein ABII90_02975 [Bacteroidota bacterium]